MTETMANEEKPYGGLRVKIFSGKEEAWGEWKLKFQGVLRSKKLLKHLTTDRPADELEGLAELEERGALEEWLDNDEAVFYELIIHTSGDACKTVQQFEEQTQGKRAWEVLKEKYEGSGSMETVELAEAILTCKMDPIKDPDPFFIKLESLQRRMKDRGQPYTDVMLRDLLIAKLPRDKYHALITSFGGERPTYDKVKERIRMHWRTFIREKQGENDDESSAKALMSKGVGEGDKQKVSRCFR